MKSNKYLGKTKIEGNKLQKSGSKSFKEIIEIVRSIREETIRLNSRKANLTI